MTSYLRKFVSGILLFAAVSIPAAAQQERADEMRQNLPLSYEALPLFSTDTTAAVVRLNYRINQRFFVFVRDPGNPNGFIATGELMVELRNKQDIAVAREIRPIRLLRDEQPLEKEQLTDIQGAFAFQVPEDEYTVIFSLDDKESGRKFLDRDKKVTTLKPEPEKLQLSYPMFAVLEQLGDDESIVQVVAANRGTNISFGPTYGLVYQVYLPENLAVRVRWKIQRQQGFLSDWFRSFTGEQYTLLTGTLLPSNPQSTATYTVRSANNPSWKILYVPLPTEKLDPGGYRLEIEITSGDVSSSKQYPFQVLWLNRPATLLNSQISIDALRHIVPEEAVDEMLTGSLETNIKRFYEFWKTKDPDTTTAYNEIMVEYYRRVDETNQRFSTLGGMDGYKTDRGRIFILYGSPTRTEKLIRPGEAPTEIWAYDRLKRRFVFSDKYKNGNFVLIATEN
ncbi:MAG TPA: GWxTD domain-containing protein [Bacteroidota bacterium]